MEKKMSVMGVGHKIAVFVLVYLGVMYIISRIFSSTFTITVNNYNEMAMAGIFAAIIGFSINMIASVQMLKANKLGRLATGGLYKLFLNPMYTLQLIITLPGLLLLFNSWLVLTTVVFAFIVAKIFVKEEEKYLEGKFGNAYIAYRSSVLFRFL